MPFLSIDSRRSAAWFGVKLFREVSVVFFKEIHFDSTSFKEPYCAERIEDDPPDFADRRGWFFFVTV